MHFCISINLHHKNIHLVKPIAWGDLPECLFLEDLGLINSTKFTTEFKGENNVVLTDVLCTFIKLTQFRSPQVDGLKTSWYVILPKVGSLIQWCLILVPEHHCPACSTCSCALTQLIQWLNELKFCRRPLITLWFKSDVSEQKNFSNMQDSGPRGPGLDHPWFSPPTVTLIVSPLSTLTLVVEYRVWRMRRKSSSRPG